MKKTELLSMVVAELKALAKKMKVSLPIRAKKADIIEALLSSAAQKKNKPAKKVAVKKAAAKNPETKIVAKSKKEEAPEKKQVVARKHAGENNRKRITPVHEWKMPPRAEEPHLAEERVAESKYFTGAGQQPAVAEHGGLPKEYGEDRIVLLTRDPFVVHAYWEVTPARLEREKSWFGWNSKLNIRIYDITGVQFDGRNAIGYYDQEVFERMGNWYFDLGRPSHSFCAELGLLSEEGRFLTLVRSNYITMPRDGVSDVIDDEWILVDEEFWKLYGSPEGFESGATSPRRGLREWELMRRRRMQEITSPGLYSGERTKTKRK
jgi:hypothetical protein